MSKILLTGATGKTGMAALRELVSQGADICAMTRNPDKANTFEERGIPAVVADFNDINSLNKALQGIESMYLVSSPSSEMVQTEKNAINAAKRAGIEYIVKLSAIGTAPNAPFSLGQHHSIIEEHLQKSGLAYTILRPHGFMQNLLGSIPTIQSQNAIYSNLQNGKLPMIDARDIGAVIAQLLIEGPSQHHRQTYVLTGPEQLSYNDLAQIIGAALEKQIQYMPVSDEEAASSMTQAGFPDWLANDLVTLNKMWRDGQDIEVTHNVGELTGQPPRSFRTFVRDHLGLFKTAS